MIGWYMVLRSYFSGDDCAWEKFRLKNSWEVSKEGQLQDQNAWQNFISIREISALSLENIGRGPQITYFFLWITLATTNFPNKITKTKDHWFIFYPTIGSFFNSIAKHTFILWEYNYCWWVWKQWWQDKRIINLSE